MELTLIAGIVLEVIALVGLIAFDTQDARFTQAVVIMVGGIILLLV